VAITIRQLAALVGGTVAGDGDLTIQAARPLNDAHPGDITFADHVRHHAKLDQCHASAAVVPMSMPATSKTHIQVADPLLAFGTIMLHLRGKSVHTPTGIDPRALIHHSTTVGADPSIAASVCVDADTTIGLRCRLYPGVVIGKNCKLGDDVVLHPNVVLYEDTVLGDRVIIHANSTIGADGFGYRFLQGKHVKVPQLGNVIIGNDVEIGANSAVDRGTFGSTRVGDGTKLDNMVQIAHNCQIGKHNAIAAQVGIGGSATTGSYVFIGGQAGIADHINIGDGTMLGAKTGCLDHVGPGKRMFLYPAHEERDAGRILACLKKLPNMRKDLLRVLKELKLDEASTESAEPMRKAS
jgi:UDP-3-O-[3-hydroxymyristoyl] glucosamine N-acyltransferase